MTSWLPTIVRLMLLLLLLAIAAAWLLQWLLYRAGRRILSKRDEFWTAVLRRTRGPVRLGIAILAVALVLNVVTVPNRELALIRHGLAIAFIVCAGVDGLSTPRLNIAPWRLSQQRGEANEECTCSHRHGYLQVGVPASRRRSQ